MNAVLAVSMQLFIDNRRTERKASLRRKHLRPNPLDDAALFPRHYRQSRRSAELAENAADGPAFGTAQRPPSSPREPERCDSSDLRSLRGEHVGVVE